jgi:putative ABC transport system substrate-binding protein
LRVHEFSGVEPPPELSVARPSPLRTLAVALGLALLAAPLVVQGQAPVAKVYRIGVLANALESADGPQFEAFLDGMAKLGYVEDQNLVIEWRSSEGDMERLPGLAADLVRSKVDLIVAMSLQPARAAAGATRTIPVVFVVMADPVGQGLVANVARPGANITGLATYEPREISERVIHLLREATIELSRLAVLMNPANSVNRDLMAQALPAAAQRAGVALLPLEVQSLGELQRAFDTATRERADALYVLADVFNFVHRARIVALAARHRLPAIYGSRRAVEMGGLMSYGPQVRDLFRRAATYVDRILKGARPGDLPVEQPTRFELAINVKTATALGLTIPPTLLGRADQVVR